MESQNEFKERLKYDKITKVDNYELKPEYVPDPFEKAELIINYREKQKEQFRSYIEYINATLCVLKRYTIVSEYTKFIARIKSIESSIYNDDRDNKELTDVFGIDINTATIGEAAIVSMILKETLQQTRVKIHNKPNGYRAYHYSGYPKPGNIVQRLEDLLRTTFDSEVMYQEYMQEISEKEREKITQNGELISVRKYIFKYCKELNQQIHIIKSIISGEKLIELQRELEQLEEAYHIKEKLQMGEGIQESQPIIEGQFKTIQVAIDANLGAASHGDYKDEDMAVIQAEYDKNGTFPISRIPEMYKSNLETDVNDVAIPPRKLSIEETAKTMYPSLILKKKKERGVSK